MRVHVCLCVGMSECRYVCMHTFLLSVCRYTKLSAFKTLSGCASVCVSVLNVCVCTYVARQV